MRIIFLEFVDEAQLILNRQGKDFLHRPDVVIVCLHPKVRAFLKKRGIPSFGTVGYLDNEAQHRIIIKTEEVISQVVEDICIRDHWGVEKGYKEFIVHHVRLYICHFLWILEILHSVCMEHEVEEVHSCLPGNRNKMYTQLAYIQDQERFLGLLAREFCAVRKLKFCSYTFNSSPKTFFQDNIARMIDALAKIIARLDVYLALKRLKPDHKVIVVPGVSYRMDLILKEIKQKYAQAKCFMIWESGRTLKQALSKIRMILRNQIQLFKKKNLLETVICLDLFDKPRNTFAQTRFSKLFDEWLEDFNSKFLQHFTYYGVSFSPYLAEKLNLSFRPAILRLQRLTDVLASILKKLDPKLVISMYSGGIYYMMGELGCTLGYKSLNITHGTHVPPNNEYERIENYRLATTVISNVSDYVAIQTPWADKFLNYYGDKRTRIYSGPLLFSITKPEDRQAVHRRLFRENHNFKIILHAATQKPRHALRFHITETLDEYIDTLIKIIGVVNRMRNVFFLIRPHPVCDIKEDEFRLLLPACERMSVLSGKAGGFSSILSSTDLLISYSSTCIEEAVQNRIPVILFDQWKRYNHFGISEIKDNLGPEQSPVYYVTETLTLDKCIAHVLQADEGKAFKNGEWDPYKYPSHYRENFYRFIDEHLLNQALQ